MSDVPFPRMRGNVLALGVVSLLTDASSEMVIPLLPLFLTAVLHGSATSLGLVEGAAEATAALLKLASGRLADRLGTRHGLILAGYAISSAARPLVALATAPWHVLAVRVADRVGKGIRTAPRDALLSLSAGPEHRGAAFGFHRAMDHAGAVVGPLLALGTLALAPGDLRLVFALAAVPGLLSVVAIAALVRDTPGAATVKRLDLAPPSLPLRRVLAPLALFTLGNASDTFLLLRVAESGRSPLELPLLWMAFHAVKVVTSLVAGPVSDRVGRRAPLATGWVVYAAVYAGFAFAEGAAAQTALFLVYGVYHGLTEGNEKALVADLSGDQDRATAFGWHALVIGLLALPASLGFGLSWDAFGPAVPFLTGSALALAAAAALSWSGRG